MGFAGKRWKQSVTHPKEAHYLDERSIEHFEALGTQRREKQVKRRS
jgi:hypothetical protein